MKYLIYILIGLSLSSCTIPLKLIPYEDPQELREEERKFREKLREEERKLREKEKRELKKVERIERKREKKIREKEFLKQEARQERNRILSTFKDPNEKLIILAFEKCGVPPFYTSSYLMEYKNLIATQEDVNFNLLEGFLDYLYTQKPFSLVTRWSLEKGFGGTPGLFSEVRKAVNLLSEMDTTKEGI